MIFPGREVFVKLLIITIALNVVNSKIVLLFNEEFEDCSKGGHAKFVDFSGLEYDYVNDTTYFLNGEL